MVPWPAFPGACFLGLSDMLGWSLNGSGMNGTQLEIATQLVRKLGHQIGHYM